MKKVLIILLLIGISLLALRFSKALYVSDSIWNYYLNSKGFYFESDYLANNKINTYNLWDGGSISFNLKNSKNDLYTEDDIEYEVECVASKNATCELLDQGSNKYSATLKGDSIKNETLYFDVASNESDVEVLITAKSKTPYVKTLTGTFRLHKIDNTIGNIKYDLINYDSYSKLTISNYYDDDKCLNVKWTDQNIRVISYSVLNPATDEDGYVDEFEVNVSKGKTESVKFYYLGNGTFTKEAFTIVECLAS